MKEIKTKQELEENTKDCITLIKVGATWCAPCGVAQKNIESIECNYSTVKFIEIDVEEADENLVSYLSIYSLPTLILYKNSEEVFRHLGLMNQKQLIELLNKYV